MAHAFAITTCFTLLGACTGNTSPAQRPTQVEYIDAARDDVDVAPILSLLESSACAVDLAGEPSNFVTQILSDPEEGDREVAVVTFSAECASGARASIVSVLGFDSTDIINRVGFYRESETSRVYAVLLEEDGSALARPMAEWMAELDAELGIYDDVGTTGEALTEDSEFGTASQALVGECGPEEMLTVPIEGTIDGSWTCNKCQACVRAGNALVRDTTRGGACVIPGAVCAILLSPSIIGIVAGAAACCAIVGGLAWAGTSGEGLSTDTNAVNAQCVEAGRCPAAECWDDSDCAAGGGVCTATDGSGATEARDSCGLDGEGALVCCTSRSGDGPIYCDDPAPTYCPAGFE